MAQRPGERRSRRASTAAATQATRSLAEQERSIAEGSSCSTVQPSGRGAAQPARRAGPRGHAGAPPAPASAPLPPPTAAAASSEAQRRPSSRKRQPTERSLESRQQETLAFNERLPAVKVERGGGAEAAAASPRAWEPREGALVWARAGTWPYWPARLVGNAKSEWREAKGPVVHYTCQFLGCGTRTEDVFDRLPASRLKPYTPQNAHLGETDPDGQPASLTTKEPLSSDEAQQFRTAVMQAKATAAARGDGDAVWPLFYKAKAAAAAGGRPLAAGSAAHGPSTSDDPFAEWNRSSAEAAAQRATAAGDAARAPDAAATASYFAIFARANGAAPAQRRRPTNPAEGLPRGLDAVCKQHKLVWVRKPGVLGNSWWLARYLGNGWGPRGVENRVRFCGDSEAVFVDTAPSKAVPAAVRQRAVSPATLDRLRAAENVCDAQTTDSQPPCIDQDYRMWLKDKKAQGVWAVRKAVLDIVAIIETADATLTQVVDRIAADPSGLQLATTSSAGTAMVVAPRPAKVVTYAEQLQLCLRRRGTGVVPDRGPTAGIRLSAQQRADHQQILQGWQEPSAGAVVMVNSRLRDAFGPRKFRPGTEHALNALLGTIMTQNTSDILSSRSFSQVHKAFDSNIHGPELRAAAIEELADLLADAGLQNTKAKRIRQLLRDIHEEQGSVSLEFLKGRPRAEVHAFLQRFLGVGGKTIACIGLYALYIRDFAIDTHLYRFAVRFGWVPTFEYHAPSPRPRPPAPAQPAPAPPQAAPAPPLALPAPPPMPPAPQANVQQTSTAAAGTIAQDPGDVFQMDQWVQCDTCDKWRKIPWYSPLYSSVPERFVCSANDWDMALNCSTEEDQLSDSDADDSGDDEPRAASPPLRQPADSDETEEEEEAAVKLKFGDDRRVFPVKEEPDGDENHHARAVAHVDRQPDKAAVCPAVSLQGEPARAASPVPSQAAGVRATPTPAPVRCSPAASGQSPAAYTARDMRSCKLCKGTKGTCRKMGEPGHLSIANGAAIVPADPSGPVSPAPAAPVTTLGPVHNDIGDIEDLGPTARMMRIPQIREVQDHMMKRFDEEKVEHAALFELHANLRTLGMRLCHAKAPRCDICPLADKCKHGRRTLAAASSKPKATGPDAATASTAKVDPQPWMSFEQWGQQVQDAQPVDRMMPDPPTDASAAAAAAPAQAATKDDGRREFKGVVLKVLNKETTGGDSNADADSWTAFPAVNTLCNAKGAGDYCQLESWEVRRKEDDGAHLHEHTGTRSQIVRQVDKSARRRLLAKYFETSDPDAVQQEELEQQKLEKAEQQKRQQERREKVLALSTHAATHTVEAAHAARIAQKRSRTDEAQAATQQEAGDGATATRPPVRRKLDMVPPAAATSSASVGRSTADAKAAGPIDTEVRGALRGVCDEIERRGAAPNIFILTEFFQTCEGGKTQRWAGALKVYHNSDLYAPPGFDCDSNFERNEVWVSMEDVVLPLDGTELRRRTIDFSASSPPSQVNYVCHSMIKTDTRGSTLHGLEEWSVATGLFTKSKDWAAIRAKWSDSALVLRDHASHSELKKVSGLGRDVRPAAKRKKWEPAASPRSRPRVEKPDGVAATRTVDAAATPRSPTVWAPGADKPAGTRQTTLEACSAQFIGHAKRADELRAAPSGDGGNAMRR